MKVAMMERLTSEAAKMQRMKKKLRELRNARRGNGLEVQNAERCKEAGGETSGEELMNVLIHRRQEGFSHFYEL